MHQQGEQALGRAKVTAEQDGVGVERRDQGDAAKVVPLGQHLRADQHVHIAAVRMRQLLRQAAGLAGGVGINAQYAQGRSVGALRGVQLLLQGFFQLLGAQAQRAHVLVATAGAGARHRH